MIRIDITLGILTTIATIFIVAMYGAREEHRMETYSRAYMVRSIERGGDMFEQYCVSCHGSNAAGSMCPPLNQYSGLHGGDRGPGVAWRLEELGLDRIAAFEYVYATIDAGRPVSTRPWRWVGNRNADNPDVMAMPAWGQNNGGPLRGDQMRDIANFIVGFESFIPEDLDEAREWVASNKELSLDPTSGISMVSIHEAPDAQGPPPSTDDPIAYGEWLFTNKTCNTCHAYTEAGTVANACPPLDGVLATAEERIAGSDYTGEADTALAYLRESLLDPGVYKVAEYDDPSITEMPQLSLTDEEVDALIAFLTGELPEGFEPPEAAVEAPADGGAGASTGVGDETDVDLGAGVPVDEVVEDAEVDPEDEDEDEDSEEGEDGG